ncbi:protein of unknown function [Methylocaldum szegediense]|uniref:Transposase n=1 Tax=Methylocaldum szegediense TaxID=73780 RepID=A0ABN8X218_9GAMM|nr:protein of unknown function [Methylocaldum szegediense]
MSAVKDRSSYCGDTEKTRGARVEVVSASEACLEARVGENSVESVHSRWQTQVEVSLPQLFPQ